MSDRLRRRSTGLMATVLVLLMFSPAATLQARTALRVIHKDMGGDLQDRLAEVEVLRGQGVAVRIEGTCVSACTLYLGLPKTCVTETAILGFHGPRTRFDGLPLPRASFERLSQQMASHYPPALRHWFMTKARLVTQSYYALTAAQAIALGVARCT
jgi:hypothetical protein